MKKIPLKWMAIFGLPAVLIASCVGCATPSQVYWDHKVKKLCEKDGGVTVYEKVYLTRDEYKNLNIPFEGKSKDSEYFYRLQNFVINDDSPKVTKGEQLLVRRGDNKVLGKSVYYGRSGGDFIVVDHPSSFGCALVNGLNFKLTESIFVVKGE